MSQTKFFGKLFSWLIAVAALSSFCASEAFAGKMCYKQSTTYCKPAGLIGGVLIDTNAECQTKYGSLGGTWLYDGTATCSLSGSVISFSGSVISCLAQETVGYITAIRGSEATSEPAVWSEFAQNVQCKFDNANPAPFDMFLQVRMQGSCVDDPDSGFGNTCNKFSDTNNTGTGPGKGGTNNFSQARCNPATAGQAYDELVYAAFCGNDVTVKGYLEYIGVPGEQPSWVDQMCTDSAGNLKNCDNDALLVLGGFQLNNQGKVDLKKCLTDFIDQSALGGLLGGQVLRYVEFYPPGTACGANGEPRIDSADAKRRMCQDHTFYNPLYDEDNLTGPATNPPCAPTKNVSYSGGIFATDAAQIVGVELYDRQWKPDSTLNLTCTNSGNVPSTAVNSDNIAVSSFTGTIEAWVKNFPQWVTVATSANPIFDGGLATGLKINWDDCNPNNTGLDEVICNAIVNGPITPLPGTIDLVIRGTPSGDGLGFLGEATGININNAGNCPTVLQP